MSFCLSCDREVDLKQALTDPRNSSFKLRESRSKSCPRALFPFSFPNECGGVWIKSSLSFLPSFFPPRPSVNSSGDNEESFLNDVAAATMTLPFAFWREGALAQLVNQGGRRERGRDGKDEGRKGWKLCWCWGGTSVH